MKINKVSTIFESKLRRVLMVALVLVVLFSLTPSAKVSAYTTSPIIGIGGQINLPTMVLIPDTYGGWYFAGNTTTNVYRSPSSTGTQIIQVIYFIRRWDGRSWVVDHYEVSYPQTVGVNQYARFDPIKMMPKFFGGFYRVSFRVDWKNAYGTLIAQTLVHTSKASEYYCTSPLCIPYTDGSVYLFPSSN